MQILPRGHDFETPDVAIIESVVLGGDSFEDIFVPLVLLEFVELLFGGDGRITLRGKGFATQGTYVVVCFLVKRACTVCPSTSICTTNVYLVANGSSCATEAISLPMSSVMYSARVVRG